MYRCKECKAEYKTKVEYCDCGNNTFDYIPDDAALRTQMHTAALTLEQKSELVSRLFFALCVIISLLVWLIPVKSEVKQEAKPKPKPTVSKEKIPNIDTIWDDTPIYQQSQTQVTSDRLTANNFSQPQGSTVKKNSTKPQQVSKPAEYEIVYNPPPVSSKKKELTQPKHLEVQKPSYNPNSPAMLKYKGDLRAALFSKFAAGSIPGSGTCEISFSVDKTGKLINRKFTHESDNKTLNDVVYYMLMSVPKYLPPPAEYNGQTIRMKFVIENGSYEISIN